MEKWYHCEKNILLEQAVSRLGFKLTSKNVTDESCLICKQSAVNNLVTLKCGHHICLDCFICWFLENDHSLNCVYCNQKFEFNNCMVSDFKH